MISSLEWFASARDLCHAMNYLRLSTEAEPMLKGREILSINPGISRSLANEFAYVGYKGGSEPGVENLTYMLRGKNDTWWAFAVNWNSDSRADSPLEGWAERVLELIRPLVDASTSGTPPRPQR